MFIKLAAHAAEDGATAGLHCKVLRIQLQALHISKIQRCYGFRLW